MNTSNDADEIDFPAPMVDVGNSMDETSTTLTPKNSKIPADIVPIPVSVAGVGVGGQAPCSRKYPSLEEELTLIS